MCSPGSRSRSGLSILNVFRRAWRPYQAILGRVDGVPGMHDITSYPQAETLDGLVVLRFDAPLIFANARTFREQIQEIAEGNPELRWIVIASEPITDVDTTAADMLVDLDAELSGRGISLRFAELKDPVRRQDRAIRACRCARPGPLLPDREGGGPTPSKRRPGRRGPVRMETMDDGAVEERMEGGARMSEEASAGDREGATGSPRLALLLAMAMFVLVVDTSLMNVSISAVVEDLGTTVSGVQSAIALEALVSAAFILIGSKVGDLIGRKRAYVLGLLGYAIGALAMSLAQGLTAIIIFWAIIGGLGASLLLPAMQSLIHGNFEGAGAAEGLRARRGLGRDRGCGRTADRRLHHHLPVVAHRVPVGGRDHRHRPVRHQARPRRALHGDRHVDSVGAVLSVFGMGGIVLSILVWQEGGEAVGALLVIGAIALSGLVTWLGASQAAGEADADRPRPVRLEDLPVRGLRAAAPADRARRHDDRPAHLPADGARVQRDARRACPSRRSR